ncbi:titin homolog [Brienomyrus brachyistius]|uniref:titin homolog n=1 Tax=Brienomyrus brachyistius TaxID=42636 RepID=UPI0020B2E374|nr:titin homolog [Brienomyrus brachyistius]XP_048828046.1 titin homolog [Brienomyrus brachyistius]
MGGKLTKRKKGYNVNDPKDQKEEAAGRHAGKQNEEDTSMTFKLKSESEASGASSTIVDTTAVEKAAVEANRTPQETNPPEEAAPEASPKEVQEASAGGEAAPLMANEELKAAEASATPELSSQVRDPGPEVSGTTEKEVFSEPQQSSKSSPPESQDVQSRPEAAEGSVTSPTDVTIEESKDSENEIIAKATEKKLSFTETTAQDPDPGSVNQVQGDSAELEQPGTFSTAISLNSKPDLESRKDPTALAVAPEISLGECCSSVLDDPSEISAMVTDTSVHHKPCVPELESTPQVLHDPEDATVDSKVSEVVEAEGNPVPEEAENIQEAPIFQASPTLDKAEGPSESTKDTETEANGIPQTTVSESFTSVDEKMEEIGLLEKVVNSPTEGSSEAGENHLYDRSEGVSTEAIITASPSEDVALGEKVKHENGEVEDVICSTPELSSPCLEQADKPAADKPTKIQQECVGSISESLKNPNEAEDGEFLRETLGVADASQALELF